MSELYTVDDIDQEFLENKTIVILDKTEDEFYNPFVFRPNFIALTNAHIDALKSGKFISWYDDERRTFAALEQESLQEKITGDEILTRAGLTSEQIEQGRNAAVLQDVSLITVALMRFVTFGAEVLQNEYGFSVEDSAAWAKKTVHSARVWMEGEHENNSQS